MERGDIFTGQNVELHTEKELYDKKNMHTHDDISASDMYICATLSAKRGGDCSGATETGDQQTNYSKLGNCNDRLLLPVGWWCKVKGSLWWRWEFWLPGLTDMHIEEMFILCNVGEYLAAKPR